MIIKPAECEPSLVYSTMIRAITPRPIAWVSTCSTDGVLNVAPFSYFNGVCSKPAALSISPVNKPDGSKKDTVINIELTKEFVVNVVPLQMGEKMLITAAEFDYEESEFEKAGLTPKESSCVSVPGIVESPIQFECSLMKIVPIGEGPLAANLIIGEILAIEIADQVLNASQKIDPVLVDAIGRMGGRDYCRTTGVFSITPGKETQN